MISLCITTHNRFELLIESFVQVLHDDRIGEIVIVDDFSDIGTYNKVDFHVREMPKVKLFRNEVNIGMSLNKAKAISLASNPWCIIFDSDNVIDSSYLDALPEYLVPSIIYAPAYARPQFDYRQYAGMSINKETAPGVIDMSAGECLFNTCNYLVNKEEYLLVYENNADMRGTDTIWFNYRWLKAGNSISVVKDMEYFHRVHEGSGFLADCDYNMKKAKEIKDLIKQL